MTNVTIDNVSEETDNLLEAQHKFIEICNSLNIDENIKDEAWNSFQRIYSNVTLEGDNLHWLACSLYVSILKTSLVREQLEISYNVPLSKLLFSVRLSLLHFFQKVRKWLEMGRYGPTLNNKIKQLERNFSVSSIVFEKYSAIFKEIYKLDHSETIKRGRKKQIITSKDVFDFCWLLYVRTKTRYPDITDDLVNSYHLLLCSLDLVFTNVLLSKQMKNFVNPEFSGAPVNFLKEDLTPTDVPSIIDVLCQTFEGLAMETKIIRKQYLGSMVEELLVQEKLKGNTDHKTGILDPSNLEFNSKYLNESYQEHILQVGDFDERIFIKDDSESHIGTPTKRVTAFSDVDERERSLVKRNLQEYFNKVKGFPPQTPLTGRQWLNAKEAISTPSQSSITTAISRLQELVKGLKAGPSENLSNIFKSFKVNPEEKLNKEINTLSSLFLEEYIKPCKDSNCSQYTNKDFAKGRLTLGLVLFYKILETFLEGEKKKSSGDLSVLFEHNILVKSLLSCCLEIVMHSYNNSNRMFPWILNAFELQPYHFFKVIELVIRSEDLSRDVIKHLSKIEEQILESLSWKTGSPIYASIETHGVPRCQEVSSDSGVMTPLIFMSPTTLRVGRDGLQNSPVISIPQKGGVPPPSPARRNLFGSAPKTESSSSTTPTKQSTTAVVLPPKSTAGNASPMPSVRFPIMFSPGSSPLRLFTVSPQRGTPPRSGVIRIQASPNKPLSKKYGSLGIFLRKLYHMAYVRLNDLCEKLEIGTDLQKKIWTCFEHSLVENNEMLHDRHIDQLLMCAVYVMAKVTKEDKSFHDIMRCYRSQPQATSDVYRRVLIQKATTCQSKEKSTQESEDNEKTRDTMKKSGDVEVKKEAEGLVDEKNVDVEMKDVKKEDEDDDVKENVYNDLIQFYNIVYIKKIKEFALKFASNRVTLDAPPLSPLPVSRKQIHSPRKVSRQHQVFISPIKPHAHMTPRSKMLYCFDSDSPKRLHEINHMIKGGTTRRRVNLDDPETGPSIAKRPMNGLVKRAQELRNEQLNPTNILMNHK